MNERNDSRNENEIYRNFYENAPVAFFSIGKNQKIKRCNKTAEFLLGYTKKELLGVNIIDLYADSPDGKTKVKSLLRKLMRGSTLYDEELLMKKKSGKLIWVSLTINSVSDNMGNVVESWLTILDITKRKLAEQKFIKENKRAELYLDLASVIIIALDHHGNIFLINKKGNQILGYEEDELIGKNWFETCIPIKERDEIRKVFNQIMSGDLEPVEYFENPVIRKDGIERIIEWHNTILYDEDGSIYGTLSSGVDITEKKEIETLKSNLLTRFAHEFKTPLISIKGFIELMTTQYQNELNEKMIKYLERIQAGANRLDKLIDTFTTTTSLEKKSVNLNLRFENLYILVKIVLTELEGFIKTRKLKIDNQMDQNTIAYIDYEKIKTLFLNVLINAIKFTPPGGIITIISEKSEKSLKLSIKDTGIGLSDKEIERLFRPFGKIETYGKGWDVMIDGMGMGLFIAKEIIELHHGKIWLESEGRNKGSTVFIEFPIRMK